MNKEEFAAVFADNLTGLTKKAAKSWQYDNPATLASYTASTNAGFKAEAEAFVAWRDELFEHMITKLDEIAEPGDGVYTLAMLEPLRVGLPELVRP